MLYRDPKCVFVSNNFGQADVVAAWLAEHGIQAQVMNQATEGLIISPLLTGVTGVEVWVVDSADAPEAVRLLGEHTVTQFAEKKSGGRVNVVCEECGAASTFPAKLRGTVQDCPHCKAFLDVEDAHLDDDAYAESEGAGDEPPSSEGITDGNSWGLTKP